MRIPGRPSLSRVAFVARVARGGLQRDCRGEHRCIRCRDEVLKFAVLCSRCRGGRRRMLRPGFLCISLYFALRYCAVGGLGVDCLIAIVLFCVSVRIQRLVPSSFGASFTRASFFASPLVGRYQARLTTEGGCSQALVAHLFRSHVTREINGGLCHLPPMQQQLVEPCRRLLFERVAS